MMSMGMYVNGVLTHPPLCVKCSQTDFPLVNRANSMSCRRYQILFDYKRMEVFKCLQVVLEMKVIIIYFPLDSLKYLNSSSSNVFDRTSKLWGVNWKKSRNLSLPH